jgi:prephenate dehydrogenase
MSRDFENISILGGGLLGGSLALALGRCASPPCRVTLWARKEETVVSAHRLGILGATGCLESAVRGADLVVLAVPVGAMPELVSAAIKAGMPNTCVLTDVGSVKRTPHHQLRPLLERSGIHFIGSHPMAGSERNGIEAVSSGLFEGAACILTNDENAGDQSAQALERFWRNIGCRTTWMTAADHDSLVARISHLPHVIAAAAARICLSTEGDGHFGGGGLRDTTRVASGNPLMWAEILTENREALVGPLRETVAELQAILSTLEAGDQEATRQWLASAKNLRDTLSPHR